MYLQIVVWSSVTKKNCIINKFLVTKYFSVWC